MRGGEGWDGWEDHLILMRKTTVTIFVPCDVISPAVLWFALCGKMK